MTTSIYIQDSAGAQYSLQLGLTGINTVYVPPGATGTWTAIAERYGFNRQTVTFQPGLGGDVTFSPIWVTDVAIAQTNVATVSAYNSIATVDQLYDYAAYMRTQQPQYVLASGGSGIATFSCNLVFNSNASSVWSYNAGTNTLTVKTGTTFASGITNTKLVTSGSLTKSGTTITGPYSSSAGPSSVISYTNLTAATILLLDNTSAQVDLQTNKTGSYVEYLAPGTTGIYTWVAEQYGNNRQSGTIDLTLGGSFSPIASWVIDSNITVINQATVAAYSSISTIDQLYDYAAYVRTKNPIRQLLTALNGTVYTSCNLVFDASASSMWAYDTLSNTLTVKTASSLASGANNTTINTTGTIATTGTKLTALYVNSSGTSARLNYAGLISSTVYLADNASVQRDLSSNKTGDYAEYIPPASTGTWNWIVERYGYVRQTASVQWTGGGDFRAIINYVADAGISVGTLSTVATYSSIDTVDQFYDYAAYMRTQQPQYALVSSSGTAAVLSCNLVIDKTASSVWSYDPNLNKLTIKSNNLTKGTKFDTISNNGTITTEHSALVTCLYVDAAGPSTSLNFTNLNNTSILVLDNLGDIYDNELNLSGSSTVVMEPGVSGSWNWFAERYGYLRLSGAFTPAGGNVPASLAYTLDSKITVGTLATVSAYTSIDTVDQFYDYAAYMRTQQPQYALVSASGSSAVATCFIVLDKTASSVWSYNAGTNTLTIKSNIFTSGASNFSTISSTHAITTANGAVLHSLYSDTSGSSDRLNFTNLTKATIYVTDGSDSQFDLQTNLNSNYTNYIAPTQAVGTWNWVVERYGYYRQNGSFNAAGAGDITPAISWIIDQSMSQTVQATVAAYTSLDTLDMLYDYAAYMRTQQPQYVVMSKVGTNVLFGATTLILDKNASSVWTYDHVSGTLIVKSDVLVPGAKFQGLSLSGNLNFANGSSTTVIYNSAGGPSSSLAFTGLNNSQIFVADDTGAEYDYNALLTGNYTDTFVPGLPGTWFWRATQYGFVPVSGTFTPGTGGTFTATCTWIPDIAITVSNVNTVKNYTSLGTAQTTYDYASYYATTQPGIGVGNIVNISGNSLNFGSYDITIDSNASSVYSISGNVVTIKASVLNANVTTTGLVQYLNGASVNGIVSDSTGFTTQTNINGLTGCSVAIVESDGETIYRFNANQTGNYVLNLPSSLSGNWTAIVTKFATKPVSYAFTLGTGLANTFTYVPVNDSGVTEQNVTTVSNYTGLNSTKMMYDYFSYWSTTEIGIPWYNVAVWVGSTLSLNNADVTFDPTFPVDVAAALNPTTLVVNIKTASLSGDLTTNGTITRQNGAVTTGLVTDATGTTSIVTISPIAVGDKVYIEDSNGGSVHYATATSTSYVLYLLPSEQVAGDWKWSVKRLGYSHSWGTFSPAGGGRISLTPNYSQIKQPDGNLMYTGSSAIGLSVNWTTSGDGTPRILVGNNSYAVQFVYDTTERALTTEHGMKWLAGGGSIITIATLAAGSFVFLGNDWQFMEATNTDYGATIEGFATSTSGQIIDGRNGPVSLLSASGLPEDLVNDIQNTYALMQEIAASVAKETSVQKAIKSPYNAINALLG